MVLRSEDCICLPARDEHHKQQGTENRKNAFQTRELYWIARFHTSYDVPQSLQKCTIASFKILSYSLP